ncbi:uncharacterized protein LOC135687784 isoform X1 [Rhopilema esculentum]|uniref:uncharacterized protein LOC135687784 isoform X1 n=1 Tax=Rhopilema esculentum TaxID=499914 RepID=UPI0031D2E65D
MEMTGQEISRESSGKAENPSEVDAVLGSSNENGEDALRKYADKQLQRTYELFEKFTEKSEAAYTSMKEDYEMLKNKETNYKEMTKKLDDVHFVDVVKLDVGGEEFKTGLQTLLKYPDSLFATQFSQSLKLKQTSNESFFIDRDGSYFRHIMNYMRTSTVTPKMKELKAELMEEAKFFGLSGLVKMLSEEEPELEKGEAGGEENKDVGMIILEDHSNQTSKLLEDAKKSLKEGQDALKNDINLLEESKENFLKMSERLQDVHFSEMIQLNVGGHIFKTSISTLQKYPNTILATMFSQRFKLEKQKDGSYFIDRDGTHFRHILNYLRFGRLPRKVIDEIGDELLEEAKYYNIEGLYKEIWNMPSIELKVGSKSYYTTRNIVHKDESFASTIFGSPTDGGAYLIQGDIKHMEEILKFLENGELPKDIAFLTLSRLSLEAQVLNMLNLQRYLSSFQTSWSLP